MRVKEIDPEFRYQMMVRGYMNKKQLSEFLGCGKDRAKKVFDHIQQDVEKEGLEQIDKNLILTDRVIKYLGLNAKKIVEAREQNKKG